MFLFIHWILQLFLSISPLSQLFGVCYRHQIQNVNIFPEKIDQFKLKISCIYSEFNRIWVERDFQNHCIMFIFTFYTTVQLSWIWFCSWWGKSWFISNIAQYHLIVKPFQLRFEKYWSSLLTEAQWLSPEII